MADTASTQIAILLYDRFTALDAIGPYEVLSELPKAEVVFLGRQRGPVRTDNGHLAVIADATLDDVPSPDVILVPGGPGVRALLDGGPVHEWLRAADGDSSWTTSVCSGSLMLAAAGLLTGRRATSHWAALSQLSALGAIPSDERVVMDGKYVTAAGVSAGIDMALSLADSIAGSELAQAIQLLIEYDPQPPHDTGSVGKAPKEIVERARALLMRYVTG